MVSTVTVKYSGWLLFCPVYLEELPSALVQLAPLPRWGWWWLMDWAINVQQAVNFVLEDFYPDAVGFYVLMVKEMEPKAVQIPG